MAKKLAELTSKISKKVNADATVKAAEILTEMTLAELRKSRGITQKDVANYLKMQQPSVAQLESREETYISTLRNYLHALGAELEIIACFSDGTRVSIER